MRLRERLFSSILRQETAFFDQTRTGELINRLSADTILVGKAVTDNVSDGLRAVAQSLAGVSMMVSSVKPWSKLLFCSYFASTIKGTGVERSTYGHPTKTTTVIAEWEYQKINSFRQQNNNLDC